MCRVETMRSKVPATELKTIRVFVVVPCPSFFGEEISMLKIRPCMTAHALIRPLTKGTCLFDVGSTFPYLLEDIGNACADQRRDLYC